MKTWIILTTMLVSTASGYVDKWNLIHFSKSEKELLECLKENTDLPEVLNHQVNNSYRESYVIKRILDLFHEQTVLLESIDVATNNLVNYLGSAEFEFSKDKIKKIKEAIKNALQICSDTKKPISIKLSSFETRIEPPRFVQEIPELAELLNMILVSPMYDLVDESQYSNFLTFSRRSLSLIGTSLHKMKNAHELFDELLSMWNRRAKLFYDYHQIFREYIGYFYHAKGVFAIVNPGYFNRRRFVSFTRRDPPASSGDRIFEMASYQAVDWDNPTTSRTFSDSKTVPMTKSWYQYERSKNKFLVTLFFYLELVDRGLIDENLRYHFDVFYSEDLLKVLYGTVADYKRYLENKQRVELSHGFANSSAIFSSLVQSLRPGDYINELDLLMMFWHRLRSDSDATTTTKNLDLSSGIFEDPKIGPSKLISTTTMSTTTTFTSTSSTSRYEESKRGKGQVTRLPSGKFIPKNQRGSGDESEGPSSPKKSKYSQRPVNSYGYIVYSNNSDSWTLPLEEKRVLMKTLFKETFFSLLKSRILAQGATSCY